MGKKKSHKDSYPERILRALVKYTPELCTRCKCHIINFTVRHRELHPQLAATAFGQGLDEKELIARYEVEIQELKDRNQLLAMLLDQAACTIHLRGNHPSNSLEACQDVACMKMVKAIGKTCTCGSAEGHAPACPATLP